MSFFSPFVLLALLGTTAEAKRFTCRGLGLYPMWISYTSAADLEASERKSAENEMREAKPFLANNGTLSVEILRHTIGAADLKYFEVVFAADGVELGRVTPEDKIPSPVVNGWWQNFMTAPLPREATLPLQAFLLDKLSNKRCGIEISTKGLKKLKE